MPIPAELRRRPPPATLAWAEQAVGPGARVVRVRRLRNSWAAAMHAIDVDAAGGRRHRLVLRRWARRDLAPDVGVVDNEVAALGVAERAEVPTPHVLAFDASGTRADVPAVLMTRLAGRDQLAPRDLEQFVAELAATLRTIHAVDVPVDTLAYFRPWGLDTATAAPRWTKHPAAWERAIEIAREPVPSHDRVFLHRDFHPGNVLWRREKVSGVIDWTHSCRGPAAADVAHCRVNLALLFGLDAADAFTDRYGAVRDLAWHDIVDVVGMGDAAPAGAWRFHDAGRTDITADRIIANLDEFLTRALRAYA